MADEQVQVNVDDVLEIMKANAAEAVLAQALSEAKARAFQRELVSVTAERDQLAALLAEHTAQDVASADAVNVPTNGKAPAKP